MNKYLTKILDEYYSDKLVDEVLQRLRFTFDLDFRTEKDKEKVCLYMKKRKYKDTEYTKILSFRYDEALVRLMSIDETIKSVREYVDHYTKFEN